MTTIIKSASEMKELSNIVEKERLEYWKKVDEEIDQHILEQIKVLQKDPVAIYHKGGSLTIGPIGKATIKYLEELGFKTSGTNYSGSGYHGFKIAW
jgi:hypothetical protein